MMSYDIFLAVFLMSLGADAMLITNRKLSDDYEPPFQRHQATIVIRDHPSQQMDQGTVIYNTPKVSTISSVQGGSSSYVIGPYVSTFSSNPGYEAASFNGLQVSGGSADQSVNLYDDVPQQTTVTQATVSSSEQFENSRAHEESISISGPTSGLSQQPISHLYDMGAPEGRLTFAGPSYHPYDVNQPLSYSNGRRIQVDSPPFSPYQPTMTFNTPSTFSQGMLHEDESMSRSHTSETLAQATSSFNDNFDTFNDSPMFRSIVGGTPVRKHPHLPMRNKNSLQRSYDERGSSFNDPSSFRDETFVASARSFPDLLDEDTDYDSGELSRVHSTLRSFDGEAPAQGKSSKDGSSYRDETYDPSARSYENAGVIYKRDPWAHETEWRSHTDNLKKDSAKPSRGHSALRSFDGEAPAQGKSSKDGSSYRDETYDASARSHPMHLIVDPSMIVRGHFALRSFDGEAPSQGKSSKDGSSYREETYDASARSHPDNLIKPTPFSRGHLALRSFDGEAPAQGKSSKDGSSYRDETYDASARSYENAGVIYKRDPWAHETEWRSHTDNLKKGSAKPSRGPSALRSFDSEAPAQGKSSKDGSSYREETYDASARSHPDNLIKPTPFSRGHSALRSFDGEAPAQGKSSKDGSSYRDETYDASARSHEETTLFPPREPPPLPRETEARSHSDKLNKDSTKPSPGHSALRSFDGEAPAQGQSSKDKSSYREETNDPSARSLYPDYDFTEPVPSKSYDIDEEPSAFQRSYSDEGTAKGSGDASSYRDETYDASARSYPAKTHNSVKIIHKPLGSPNGEAPGQGGSSNDGSSYREETADAAARSFPDSPDKDKAQDSTNYRDETYDASARFFEATTPDHRMRDERTHESKVDPSLKQSMQRSFNDGIPDEQNFFNSPSWGSHVGSIEQSVSESVSSEAREENISIQNTSPSNYFDGLVNQSITESESSAELLENLSVTGSIGSTSSDGSQNRYTGGTTWSPINKAEEFSNECQLRPQLEDGVRFYVGAKLRIAGQCAEYTCVQSGYSAKFEVLTCDSRICNYMTCTETSPNKRFPECCPQPIEGANNIIESVPQQQPATRELLFRSKNIYGY